MSRATIAQMKLLGLDSFAINQMQDSELQPCLDAAADRIDGVLATQFPPPLLAPFPMDLIECECVLASWTALLVRGYNPGKGTDGNIGLRRTQWEEWLVAVAKGEVIPKIIASADQSSTGATGPTVITSTQRGYSERGVDFISPPRLETDPFSGD